MNLYLTLAIVALLVTVVMLVRGIVSMSRGGEADYEASTKLMFRRVEFQAAALALVVAGALLGVGWLGPAGSTGGSLHAHLGVLPADVIEQRYGPESDEARAYGSIPEYPDAYLVTVTMTDPITGERVDADRVMATVGRLGLSGATKELEPAELAGRRTYGNYFRMSEAGIYNIDLQVTRAGADRTDLVSLEYHRPPAQQQ